MDILVFALTVVPLMLIAAQRYGNRLIATDPGLLLPEDD
jgi:hypothetical protein